MYFDLTLPITTETVAYPGDPTFKQETLHDVKKGGLYTLKAIHMGNHTGTHIDFPAHVIDGGKTSSDYNVDHFVGETLIIEVPYSDRYITSEHLSTIDFKGCVFVFFKTRNSQFLPQQTPRHDHAYLEKDAAKILIENGIRIVGIDYISIDACDSEDLTIHKMLLSNDVLILENLFLKDTISGFYKVYISPLNIPDMDGLPVRVIAKSRYVKPT